MQPRHISFSAAMLFFGGLGQDERRLRRAGESRVFRWSSICLLFISLFADSTTETRQKPGLDFLK